MKGPHQKQQVSYIMTMYECTAIRSSGNGRCVSFANERRTGHTCERTDPNRKNMETSFNFVLVRVALFMDEFTRGSDR